MNWSSAARQKPSPLVRGKERNKALENPMSLVLILGMRAGMWSFFHPLKPGALPQSQIYRLLLSQIALHVQEVRGKNTGSLISEGFERSYANKVTLAVELFTDWLTEALVTDLSELIVWLSFTVFPSSPLQLLHVITGNLSASHLQKDIMKSNSKDIHSFLLDYLPWLRRWGVDGLFPTAPHSGHLHTQCRQGLAALQQLLHASLASETTLMIMWDTQVSSLNGSFYLLSIKGGM